MIRSAMGLVLGGCKHCQTLWGETRRFAAGQQPAPTVVAVALMPEEERMSECGEPDRKFRVMTLGDFLARPIPERGKRAIGQIAIADNDVPIRGERPAAFGGAARNGRSRPLASRRSTAPIRLSASACSRNRVVCGPTTWPFAAPPKCAKLLPKTPVRGECRPKHRIGSFNS